MATDNLKAIYARRRAAVMCEVRKNAAGALLVSKCEDVSYLSGFTGEDSLLLVADGRAWLLTDGRFDEQAAGECPGVRIRVRRGPMGPLIAQVLKEGRLRGSMAVQGDVMTIQARESLLQALATHDGKQRRHGARARYGIRIKPVSGILIEQRQVKDAGEIAAIRKAIRIAQDAFWSLVRQGRTAFVGKTERRIAAELEYRMRLAGADKPSFDTIVAAGPHGSQPHYRAGSAVIREGQPVLIDWGAMVGGYVSDLTRVVFTGTIRPKMAEVYEIVRRSQVVGISAVKAGVAAKGADAAARRVIQDAGFGERFVHSLGHGIGREVHELPGLAQTSKAVLAAGMVVTVEPGIYLPGVGGVRIEDDVEVTAKGARRLSSLPTELAAMMLK